MRLSHGLGELRFLVIDVGHADADGGRPRARHLPLVHRHHNELIEVVGPLVVQGAGWEDGAVSGDREVRAQGVVGQLRVPVRVTVTGRHCGVIGWKN